MRDAYMCDWTADFLIGHLQTTGNRWPGDWEDLRDEFEAGKHHGYAFTFDELKEQVVVDWNVAIQEVANADPSLQLVKLQTGRTAGFEGDDPNDRLRDYCQSVMQAAEK